MKNLSIGKFWFFLLLTLLISFNVVKSMDVTQPILEYPNLMRGDSTRFYFIINTKGYPDKQTCTYSANGLDPLDISFEEDEVSIDPGEKEYIYGTLSVPEDAPIQNYRGSLVVGCVPEVEFEGSGGTVKMNFNVNFPVNIVEEVMEIPPQPLPEKPMPAPPYLTMFVIIIIVLILVIGVYYWHSKKKKE